MDLLKRGTFDENNSFKAYNPNHVIKCDGNRVDKAIEQIKASLSDERFLMQIPSTVGLTSNIVESLPDNVDIRIIGGLTEEYAKSTKSNNMDYLREKATYRKEELLSIISEIEKIEAGINPTWSPYEKALYLYDYMKYSITYRKPNSTLEDGEELDIPGNTYRTRTWDTLTGLIYELSTCSGFAHIYQELCTRQAIECVKVGGRYGANGEGSHAWNVVTIDDHNFIVDIIWDAQNYEKGIDTVTGFGNCNKDIYMPKCYKEKHTNLSKINDGWIKVAHEKVSSNIPKEHLHREKIERFLKIREMDRKRMMELRGEQISKFEPENQMSPGGVSI